MKTCGEGCVELCDSCIYYDFNANALGAYTGDGWCKFHKESMEPYDGCNDFYCKIAYQKEGWI